MKPITGKLKKFDQNLYDKYDKPAREKIKSLLKDFISDNPDIYGEDMIINIPGCKYKFLELQVCIAWVSEKYPYDFPYVYARKTHFSDDTLFLILNKQMTKGLLFNKCSICSKPKRLKKFSRYFVHQIPWHQIIQLDLDILDKEYLETL